MEEIVSTTNSDYRHIKVKGNWFYLFVKRCFDIVSSGLMILVLFLPLLFICFLKAIEDLKTPYWKLEIKKADGNTKKRYSYWNQEGEKYEIKLVPDVEKNKAHRHKWISPIYKSQRVGKDGKIFTFYKIRSMVHHAEEMKDVLVQSGFNEVDPPMFKMTYDPRITKLGRFIRKTSIDELPQILNVFKGDISVIGPRSPLVYEFSKFDDYSKQKVLVKGGLLCLWQVSHKRNAIQFKQWIDLDLEYIENRSLWLDTKILFKGVWMVLFDKTGE